MITVNDHQTIRLFDSWEYLGPKRKKLLDSSWSGIFRKYLLEKLPVNKIARHFDEVMGRPSKELYTAMGSLILQQLHDLSDPEVIMALAFHNVIAALKNLPATPYTVAIKTFRRPNPKV